MKFLNFVFLLFVACAAIFAYPSYLFFTQASIPSTIQSPLPDLLTQAFPSVLGASESWRPVIQDTNVQKTGNLKLTATSVVSYDLTTDTLLYSKNIRTRVPLASLTKIMTAIVALENQGINDEMRVSKSAAKVGENSMGLEQGEILKLEDLLYGLVLASGNDAAETIAENSKFGRDDFVYIMNKKAEDLGLYDTHFTNPSGLEGDGKQYSTAYDLLVMTRYGLQNPNFAKIVSTVNHEIPASEKHKAFYLYNETNLLTSYPGVKGVKTGYTYEAGLCLVSYLEQDGHHIIAILLNAQNRRQEMKDLLDYSLKELGLKPPPHD